jgi:hypothetical protein
MNPVIKAVLFVYAIMMIFVLGVAFAPARAQIVIAPPHVELGEHHWHHDYHPYRYEDHDRDNWRHHHRHHHHDDDED